MFAFKWLIILKKVKVELFLSNDFLDYFKLKLSCRLNSKNFKYCEKIAEWYNKVSYECSFFYKLSVLSASIIFGMLINNIAFIYKPKTKLFTSISNSRNNIFVAQT